MEKNELKGKCFTCADSRCRDCQIAVYNLSSKNNCGLHQYLKDSGCSEWKEKNK